MESAHRMEERAEQLGVLSYHYHQYQKKHQPYRMVRKLERKVQKANCDAAYQRALLEYPELEEKKEFIFKVLNQEEDKFNKTIDQGLRILSDMEEEMTAAGQKTLSGDNAFKLYDTYGFPLDLTKEILEEKGFLELQKL